MRAELSFERFFQLLCTRWRTFVVVALMAAGLSALLSGPRFITPRFRSSAIVYPVNLNSYSIETRTDQLLQLLESNSIRDSLIAEFGLMAHWKLDTAVLSGRYYLYNEYKDRVDISKTRYESVQIEVVDEDPVLARDLVREMLRQADLLARRLQREKSAEVLAIAERALKHEKAKMDSAEARLRELREKSGLLVYEAQTEELTKGYVRMLTRPGATQAQKEEVQGMLDELEKQGGEFRGLTDLADMFRQNYDRLLTDAEKVRNDMTKELTYTNVIVYPEVSDKKVYPIRWLIVMVATASAVFLAFVLLAWRDLSRRPSHVPEREPAPRREHRRPVVH